MIKFILSMESQSLKNELLKYFGYTTESPSNASFNQRRSQILSEAFQYLFTSFTAKYTNNPSLYKGYRLLACDGSDINIAHNPDDRDTYFSNGENKGFNQLHLKAMFDLLDKLYTDVIIQPAKIENEHYAFCEMVDRYDGMQKTIFIVDRGYESYHNLAHVMEKGAFFIFRCKDMERYGILSGLKHKLPDEEEFDVTVSFILTCKCTNEVRDHPEIYKSFHKKIGIDSIDLDKNPYYKMKFRVLRFPISETDYECILTNLPEEEFDASEIKKLYAMRWAIETSFRELKYAVGLTSFHSKKREYIIQEIWARLVLYNFCEVITAQVAINKCTKKHTYQINYTFAINICRYFISKMAFIFLTLMTLPIHGGFRSFFLCRFRA